MDTAKRDPDTLLPLTPAVFHILLALVDSERHGYGVMQEIAARTEGKVRMGPGTLYGSIQRMLAASLIEEVAHRRRTSDDERRRYYRMTPFGRRVLKLELQRLTNVVRLARPRAESFAHFLARSPLADVVLDIARPRDSGRRVKL